MEPTLQMFERIDNEQYEYDKKMHTAAQVADLVDLIRRNPLLVHNTTFFKRQKDLLDRKEAILQFILSIFVTIMLCEVTYFIPTVEVDVYTMIPKVVRPLICAVPFSLLAGVFVFTFLIWVTNQHLDSSKIRGEFSWSVCASKVFADWLLWMLISVEFTLAASLAMSCLLCTHPGSVDALLLSVMETPVKHLVLAVVSYVAKITTLLHLNPQSAHTVIISLIILVRMFVAVLRACRRVLFEQRLPQLANVVVIATFMTSMLVITPEFGEVGIITISIADALRSLMQYASLSMKHEEPIDCSDEIEDETDDESGEKSKYD